MRAAIVIGTLTVSWVIAYYSQRYAEGNSDAILILVTVITVFAGFLVAIIAVLGDPALIPAGTWRTAENRRENIGNEPIPHTWLFVFYLVSIGGLFAWAPHKGGAMVPQAVDKMGYPTPHTFWHSSC